MRRRPLAQMIVVAVLAAIAGTALVLAMDWFPTAANTASSKIDTLYDVLLLFSVPIFVLVMAIAIYSVVKFRARPGQTGDGPPIHGNTRLEIFWVTIPFLIVSGLAIYGWIVLDDIEAKKPDELTVNVTGQQFAWTFEYPAERVKTTQLALPVDRPVHFNITTKDVLHSFFVPQFRLKKDAVPGLTTDLRLTPTRVGSFPIICAELCGLGHSTMRQTVRVVPPARFAAFIERQRRGGSAAGGGGGATQAADGKQVFQSQACGSCHKLADAGGAGTTGPDLDRLRSVAAGRERGKSAQAYVRQAIEDPRAFVVKGYPPVMPTTFGSQLSPEELDALVKYLLEVSK